MPVHGTQASRHLHFYLRHSHGHLGNIITEMGPFVRQETTAGIEILRKSWQKIESFILGGAGATSWADVIFGFDTNPCQDMVSNYAQA